jgi:hypothetical protein
MHSCAILEQEHKKERILNNCTSESSDIFHQYTQRTLCIMYMNRKNIHTAKPSRTMVAASTPARVCPKCGPPRGSSWTQDYGRNVSLRHPSPVETSVIEQVVKIIRVLNLYQFLRYVSIFALTTATPSTHRGQAPFHEGTLIPNTTRPYSPSYLCSSFHSSYTPPDANPLTKTLWISFGVNYTAGRIELRRWR